jgi:hypothetical protein
MPETIPKSSLCIWVVCLPFPNSPVMVCLWDWVSHFKKKWGLNPKKFTDFMGIHGNIRNIIGFHPSTKRDFNGVIMVSAPRLGNPRTFRMIFLARHRVWGWLPRSSDRCGITVRSGLAYKDEFHPPNIEVSYNGGTPIAG